jgi:hypothetical protein
MLAAHEQLLGMVFGGRALRLLVAIFVHVHPRVVRRLNFAILNFWLKIDFRLIINR